MKIVSWLFGLLLLVGEVGAQSNYNTKQIPDSLKEHADAVIRSYKTTYERSSVGDYSVQVHLVVTVMNKNGYSKSWLELPYDRNSKVTSVKGYIYDKNGSVVDKIKKKDFKDFSANEGFILYSDNRVMVYRPVVSHYPFTIEYNYTTMFSGVIGFDGWFPSKGYRCAVQDAELVFNTTEECDVRYREVNHDFISESDAVDQKKMYSWRVENIKAIEYEPLSGSWLGVLPGVLLAPNAIEYEGTKGDFSTWNSYGKWAYSLMEGRDELPKETVEKMKALTDTIAEVKGKIKAIYNYMQSRTRYTYIGLGIGGFQPIFAKDVDEKGYGDCKALSNYTKALLKSVGIEAFYVIIGSGDNSEIKYADFASANQTNHIIVCAPNAGDSIWLECTSQKIPFGYIGQNNVNRYALLIKPEGGVLVRTPNYTVDQNLRSSTIDIELEKTGAANYAYAGVFENCQFDNVFGLIMRSPKEQKDRLLHTLSPSGIHIDNFRVENCSSDYAQGSVRIAGNLTQYASVAGSRLFFGAEYFFEYKHMSRLLRSRKHNLIQPTGYTYIDTIHVKLPLNYTADFSSEPLKISSFYGEYDYTISQHESVLTIVRKLKVFEGVYSPDLFDEINEFLDKVEQSDTRKIIASAAR